MIKNLCMKIFILLLITLFLGGCGASDEKDARVADELTGAFAGPAGHLSFYPDREVLVSVSDDYVWLLEGKENDQTCGYIFILGNEEISYDKAEAFYLHDGSDTFAKTNCRRVLDLFYEQVDCNIK